MPRKRTDQQAELPFAQASQRKRANKRTAKKKAPRVRTSTKRRKRIAVADEGHPIDWQRVPCDDSTTLGEIRDLMRAMVKEGVICPACEQPARIYKRKLNSSMAYVLILMVGEYQLNGGTFMHVPSMLNRKRLKPRVAASLRGDYAKLRYWGFIQEDKQPKKRHGEDRGKRKIGFWKPTEAGIAFARGQLDAPSHAILYGSRCLRLTEDSRVTIQAALGDRWDYVELMTDLAD